MLIWDKTSNTDNQKNSVSDEINEFIDQGKKVAIINTQAISNGSKNDE